MRFDRAGNRTPDLLCPLVECLPTSPAAVVIRALTGICICQDVFTKERRVAKAEWKRIKSTLYQTLMKRTSALAEHVSRHAMDMTQIVVLQQNKQRKVMINRIKVSFEVKLYLVANLFSYREKANKAL